MTGPAESVPGSGALSDREKQLAARVQSLVTIAPETVMIKVIRPSNLDRYLNGEVSSGSWGQRSPFDYRVVGGVVGREQDCTGLRTPGDFVRAFRLDYPGSPFRQDMPSLDIMAFLAVRPSHFVTPLGAPSLPYPEIGFPSNNAEVYGAAVSMVSAAESVELDPNTYRQEIRLWPYTGTGLTAAGDFALPERWRRFGPIPNAATVLRCDNSGRRVPVAIFRGHPLAWEAL